MAIDFIRNYIIRPFKKFQGTTEVTDSNKEIK